MTEYKALKDLNYRGSDVILLLFEMAVEAPIKPLNYILCAHCSLANKIDPKAIRPPLYIVYFLSLFDFYISFGSHLCTRFLPDWFLRISSFRSRFGFGLKRRSAP